MPVEDDYMMVIIPCIAEIAASDTPERVKKLRLGAVSELQRYAAYCSAYFGVQNLDKGSGDLPEP